MGRKGARRRRRRRSARALARSGEEVDAPPPPAEGARAGASADAEHPASSAGTVAANAAANDPPARPSDGGGNGSATRASRGGADADAEDPVSTADGESDAAVEAVLEDLLACAEAELEENPTATQEQFSTRAHAHAHPHAHNRAQSQTRHPQVAYNAETGTRTASKDALDIDDDARYGVGAAISADDQLDDARPPSGLAAVVLSRDALPTALGESLTDEPATDKGGLREHALALECAHPRMNANVLAGPHATVEASCAAMRWRRLGMVSTAVAKAFGMVRLNALACACPRDLMRSPACVRGCHARDAPTPGPTGGRQLAHTRPGAHARGRTQAAVIAGTALGIDARHNSEQARARRAAAKRRAAAAAVRPPPPSEGAAAATRLTRAQLRAHDAGLALRRMELAL